jgi:hypothetical protein
MSSRPAGERRVLGLWTAGCLAAALALGVTRLGDWSLQWPVLLVPLLWALVALRPRRGTHRRGDELGYDEHGYDEHADDASSYWDAPDHWDDGEDPYRPEPRRTDTVEAPWVRDERRGRPE